MFYCAILSGTLSTFALGLFSLVLSCVRCSFLRFFLSIGWFSVILSFCLPFFRSFLLCVLSSLLSVFLHVVRCFFLSLFLYVVLSSFRSCFHPGFCLAFVSFFVCCVRSLLFVLSIMLLSFVLSSVMCCLRSFFLSFFLHCFAALLSSFPLDFFLFPAVRRLFFPSCFLAFFISLSSSSGDRGRPFTPPLVQNQNLSPCPRARASSFSCDFCILLFCLLVIFGVFCGSGSCDFFCCLVVTFFVPFPEEGYQNPCLPITFCRPQTANAVKYSICSPLEA